MQVTQKRKRIAELAILFLFCPLLLGLSIPLWLKLGSCLVALAYVGVIAFKLRLFSFKKIPNIPAITTYLICLRFILFAVISTFVMWKYAPEKLFYVVISNPKLWITMSLVYTFASVIPQEFVYRSFFFKRYQGALSSYSIFVAVSAITFSFAHFFLNNTLVFVLTFLGGILFTSSYKKHGSLWLVSAEHSAYGVWLFTIGLGDMLAFPGGPQ